MSKGVNKVTLIGNLGADPETRHLTNGSAVTTISIATSESWKNKETGDIDEKTEWHKITFFGKLAEIAEQYLKKGAKVYVEGKLKYHTYEKDGHKVYAFDIVAHEMQMLSSKDDKDFSGQVTHSDEIPF